MLASLVCIAPLRNHLEIKNNDVDDPVFRAHQQVQGTEDAVTPMIQKVKSHIPP